MKSREVIRRLRADGWELVRIRGDHHHFKKEGVAFLVTVPHPTRDLKTGTLRNIFRQAGWRWPPDAAS